MTPMVPLAMFGWPPLAIWLFARFRHRPRLAVIAGFLLAWMFLPNYGYKLPALPDYTKISAACFGILLGAAIFDPAVFRRFRLRGWDAPLLVWTLVPFLTSLSNGLGAYDGVSAALGRFTQWGIPYFLGRLYFNRREALEDLLLGFFIGTLVYIPFCWFEIVMSPRLHRIVYGFHPHSFAQAKRSGGWRPVIFMQHGLMNSMWMVSGFVAGFSLLISRRLGRRLPGPLPAWTAAIAVLFVTIILLKSTGALFLLLLGTLVLMVFRTLRTALPLVLLLAIPLTYATVRSTGLWDGTHLIEAAASAANAERTGSLAFRIENETILAGHALKRPLLGWGEWGRSFVRDEEGRIVSVPDGLWILAFGKSGYVGLSALLLLFFVPPLLFLRRYPPATWKDPAVAAVLAGPLLLALFALDSLMNDMFNPLMLLLAGGLTGLWLQDDPGDTNDVSGMSPPAPVQATGPRLI